MNRHHACLAVLLGAVIPTNVAAQRVWIVDNVNAAGAHFPDLPQALASPSVVDGDVLLLRGAGPYLPAATSKGVSIVAQGNATIGQSVNPTGLTVSSLPAGTRFSLRNVSVVSLRTPVALSACAGSVHLDHVTISSAVPNPGWAGIMCSGCSAVTVQACRIDGKPAIQGNHSSISVTSSTLVGMDADSLLSYSAPGLQMVACDTALACSTVVGGSGGQTPKLGPPGSPALSAYGGSLVVGGDASTSSFTAGMPGLYGSEMIPAVSLTAMGAGSVAIDPRVPMTSRNNAPTILGAPVNSVQTVAALGVSRPSAFAINVRVIRLQGDLVALLVGMPVPPVNQLFGREWLDAGIRMWLAGGVIDATQAWTQAIVAPNTPLLFGLPLGLQAGVLGTRSAQVTNPTVVLLGG